MGSFLCFHLSVSIFVPLIIEIVDDEGAIVTPEDDAPTASTKTIIIPFSDDKFKLPEIHAKRSAGFNNVELLGKIRRRVEADHGSQEQPAES